jgi:glycosyltransferase involved in cell wall biosynthesis
VRLAILGTRGVPARDGGFETFAEELGGRLAARGHDVTVYGRTRWVPRGQREYRGMHIVRLPAPRSKYLETVVHTVFSAIHALRSHWDVVYVCNLANVPSVVLLRAAGKRVVLNVDGLEWQRAKWGPLGRAYYRLCARVASRLPVELVTDARVIQGYYQTAYGRSTSYFPYGTDMEPVPDDGSLARLGLTAGQYVLYVSRLEPENNADVVIAAYANLKTDLPLAVIGDAPYASEYIGKLKAAAAQDRRIRLLGAHYGHAYRVLRSHAAAYVQATEVGGTHPALVEAMGYGNAIAANDVPEHREVLADAAVYYRGAEQLQLALQRLLDDPALNAQLRSAAHDRARSLYGWDAVATAYESWILELAVAAP